MSETPYKSFGFNYYLNGKNFMIDVVATSEEEAKQKIVAIGKAELIGELQEDQCRLSQDSYA